MPYGDQSDNTTVPLVVQVYLGWRSALPLWYRRLMPNDAEYYNHSPRLPQHHHQSQGTIACGRGRASASPTMAHTPCVTHPHRRLVLMRAQAYLRQRATRGATSMSCDRANLSRPQRSGSRAGCLTNATRGILRVSSTYWLLAIREDAVLGANEYALANN